MKLRILCLAASLSLPVAIAYSQSANHNPGLAWQGPDHYSFTVGEVKVTALSDGYKAGVPVEEAVKQANWGEYSSWTLASSQGPIAVRRVYEELSGKLH